MDDFYFIMEIFSHDRMCHKIIDYIASEQIVYNKEKRAFS